MAKVQKETTFLVSSAGTGYFYPVRRNKKKTKGEGKLSFMKYDPIVKKHVPFEEKSKLSELKRQKGSSKSADSSTKSKEAA